MALHRICTFTFFSSYILMAALWLSGANAQAATLIVDATGSGDFTTPQAAVDAASAGDTILIRPGTYESEGYYGSRLLGLHVDKGVDLVGVNAEDLPITDVADVQATVVSAAEASVGMNFLVSAPDVTIQGLRLEAVARGNDPSLPAGAINKALEVFAGGFELSHSVVAAAPGYNFDGLTSTAVYFGDEEEDDLESFRVAGNILEGGITVTNGAGDSGHPQFEIVNNIVSGSHFLRVRGKVSGIGWLREPAALPGTVAGNDLTAVSGFLLQSWDDEATRLADIDYLQTLIYGNLTGPYAYITDAEGRVASSEYPEYTGFAPAVFLSRAATSLPGLEPGQVLHQADAHPEYITVDAAGGGFSSVQRAVDFAKGGDIIQVRPGVYQEQATDGQGRDMGLFITKSVRIVGVTAEGEPIADATQVEATLVSGSESSAGSNFMVTAPNVSIQGVRLEAIARGNDPSLPAGAINKAIEVTADNFMLLHSVVAAADGFNFDGLTSTAVYLGDADEDDLEHFSVHANILEGGITITNGAGDSGDTLMVITDNVASGSHFLRVRGKVTPVGWLNQHAGLPDVVIGNDLTAVSGFLLQSWDEDVTRLADLEFLQSMIQHNKIGAYAFVTTADGSLATPLYAEYSGIAPAVFLARTSDGLAPLQDGEVLNTGDTLLEHDADNDGIVDSIEGMGDSDGDGTPDYLDADSDNDDIEDRVEGAGDSDGDGIPDYLDDDSDNDGIPDSVEGVADPDQDGIPSYLDDDSDGDGIADATEGAGDSDGDGSPDYLDTSIDEDGDGIPDIVEGNADPDQDGIPNFEDIDSDNDGVPDRLELGGTGNDADGDGIADAFDVDFTRGEDANGDGIDDAPIADTDGDGLNDLIDPDQDNDGIPDAIEAGSWGFDSDQDGIDDRWDADTLGNVDTNADGIADDARALDTDADGIPDLRDIDSDNDGVADAAEAGSALIAAGYKPASSVAGMGRPGGRKAAVAVLDTDGDGVPDFRDLDSDNDSIPDVTESGGRDLDGDGLLDEGGVIIFQPIDSDGDGTPDMRDVDSDGDGVMDIALTVYAALDADGDGRIDDHGEDLDGDGLADAIDGEDGQPGSRVDNDGDGVPAHRDLDDDNDGIPDEIEGSVDTDGDGTIDRLDRDSDNDGIADWIEAGLPAPLGVDVNLNGIDDAWDTLISSVGFEERDSDGDGIPDRLDTDSDNDGLSDAYETLLVSLSGADSDGDGIDDAIDVEATHGVDANGDGIDDAAINLSDFDNDGLPAYRDADSDNDGIEDGAEDGDFNNDGINDRFQKEPGVGTAVEGGGGSMGLFGLMFLFVPVVRAGLSDSKRALRAWFPWLPARRLFLPQPGRMVTLAPLVDKSQYSRR